MKVWLIYQDDDHESEVEFAVLGTEQEAWVEVQRRYPDDKWEFTSDAEYTMGAAKAPDPFNFYGYKAKTITAVELVQP